MKQSELYHLATRFGFTATLFSDHPNFFSSWSVKVTKNEIKYMIEHDGRDGWLIFYRENQPNIFIEIDKTHSHSMDDKDKLMKCELWLSSP